MLITLEIPNPPENQSIIEIPLHFCGGKVVEAGGFCFEEHETPGKWVIITGSYRCSKCLYSPGKRDDDSPWLSEFCPHCGAKMEGAEE